MNLSTYLFFDGDCASAFDFYAACTGGSIVQKLPFAGAPGEEGIPPDWREKVMHASLRIGDNLLMASDAPPGRQTPMGGFAVSLQVDDPDQAERFYAALSDGGEISMPMQETFWARRFGMFKDRFGVKWMVNCPRPE